MHLKEDPSPTWKHSANIFLFSSSTCSQMFSMAITMKPYLHALLLSLLLIPKSLSFPVHPPSDNIRSKQFGKEVREKEWSKTLNEIMKNVSSSQPKAPQEKVIANLSQIKEYFYNFGYLQHIGPFNDYLDDNTISSIKSYQQHFNLQVTGELNKETIQHISLPRCGVPDKNFEYGFAANGVSWPKGKQWFPKGKKSLTYGFLPANQIPVNVIQVFRDAFTRWSQTTRVVNLTETTYVVADIKVRFFDFGEGVEDVVVGDSIVRRRPFSDEKIGEMRLDVTRKWMLPNENYSLSIEEGNVHLETVVMHQIGHLLGLDHSSNEDSVMYPTILPSQPRKVQITVSDNDTIHHLFTNNNLLASSSGTLTTWSLGFASMISLALAL